VRTRRLLPTIVAALWALMMLPGCGGGGAETPVAVKLDTTVQPGAVRDTAPDTTATVSAAQPDTQKPAPVRKAEPASQKPKPGPERVAEEPSALPRMWDYGSEKCAPCKTMLEILTPMIADYEGKVDIRIINVYEEQQLAAQAGIQMIPTQVFYDPEGKELFRHIGVYPRDSIEAKFTEFGMPVVKGTSPQPAGGATGQT